MELSRGKQILKLSLESANVRKSTRQKFVSTRLCNYEVTCFMFVRHRDTLYWQCRYMLMQNLSASASCFLQSVLNHSYLTKFPNQLKLVYAR